MGYKGFSKTDFARNSATTLAKHIREVELSMARNFAFGAMLEANGRINYSNGGRGFDWPVQYRFHNVEGNTGETQRNFTRRNLHQTASLEYRGYQATDSMYYKEFLENRGEEGIVKVFDSFVERLSGSINNSLGTEYYIDGTLAANSQSWHGMESMFGISGTVDTSGTAGFDTRAVNASDIVGYPSTTYANISTILGNYGGDNEASLNWPDGLADSQADFWSPLIVNYDSNHADFPESANTWAGQGHEAMRYAIINSQRNTSKNGQITNIWLARDLYMGLLNNLDAKERIVISGEDSLRALGFKNVLNFDGVEVTWEAGVPSAVGYGMNINAVELKSMDATLLKTEGPEYDIHSQSFNAVVSTLSNLKFTSPRNCFKLALLAT